MPSHTEALIVIDGLRFDVAEWAIAADLVPNLQSIASRGWSHTNYWTVGSPTQFSMSSLMSGERPLDGFGYEDGIVHRGGALAKDMQQAGYLTLGSSGSADLSHYRGYGEGFDFYANFVCFYRRIRVFNLELSRLLDLQESGLLSHRSVRQLCSRKLHRLIAAERLLKETNSFNSVACLSKFCMSWRAAESILMMAQALLHKNELSALRLVLDRQFASNPPHTSQKYSHSKIASDFLKATSTRSGLRLLSQLAALAQLMVDPPNRNKAMSDVLIKDYLVENLRFRSKSPIFVYAHFLGVHDGTVHPSFGSVWEQQQFGTVMRRAGIPRPFWRSFKYVLGLMSTDELLGDLLKAVRGRAGRDHRIVVTADHGFMLPGYRQRSDNRGFAVASRFFDEIYKVPLLVEGSPRQIGPDIIASDQMRQFIRDSRANASLIDVDGCLVFENLGRGSGIARAKSLRIAVRSGAKKVVVEYPVGWFQGANTINVLESYDLRRDPRERENLAKPSAGKLQDVQKLISIANRRMADIRVEFKGV